MAKLIWKGEDTATVAGPSFTTCYGDIKFPKDVPVEITDPEILRKARGNTYFKVIEETKEKSHGESQTQSEGKSEEVKKEKQEDYDYRKAEKIGYTPVKKKVRKRKPRPASPASTAVDADANS